MFAMSTRFRVAVVGQFTGPSIIKATFNDVDDVAASRAALIATAAAKLAVSVLCIEQVCMSQRLCSTHMHTRTHTHTHTPSLQVRMFLGGGTVIDDVTMLEKDDIVCTLCFLGSVLRDF